MPEPASLPLFHPTRRASNRRLLQAHDFVEPHRNREAISLAVGWLTLFVIGADLFVGSPLLPDIATAFAVSPVKAGLSITLFSLVYMISAPFLGHLADKLGRRRLLACNLTAFAMANFLTAASSSFGWLLIARMAAGAAAAGIAPMIYALVGAHAPATRRATHLAIVVSGLLMSLSLAAPAAAVLDARFGWASVFAAIAVAGLGLALANFRVWPNDNADAGPVAASSLRARTVLVGLIPTIVWSTALYAMYTYLGVGLAASGYAVGEVAEVILCYGAGALGGALFGGRLTDRFGARVIGTTSLAALSCSLLLARATIASGLTLCSGAFLLTSVSAQLFFPAQQARLARDYPNRRATVLAWNNSALFLGICLGSLLGGQVVAQGGFTAVLEVSAALAAIGCAANLAVVSGS